MTGDRPVRVVLVDDQALVRSGLRMILEVQDDIAVVGEAGDGATAVRLCAELRPDVVLMDVRMPGMDGIEASRRVAALALDPPPRVVVLTTFDRDRYVYDALRAGAIGFLTKDVGRADLVESVRVAARGEAMLAPSVTRRLIEQFVSRPRPGPERPDVLADLTDREVEVLRLVATGMSNTEIAERLFLGEATVKTHLNRLLAKLRLTNRTQAAVLAYECGLVRPRGHDPRR
ncbi:MAG: response regulator [Actinomycetes bacterium]